MTPPNLYDKYGFTATQKWQTQQRIERFCHDLEKAIAALNKRNKKGGSP